MPSQTGKTSTMHPRTISGSLRNVVDMAHAARTHNQLLCLDTLQFRFYRSYNKGSKLYAELA